MSMESAYAFIEKLKTDETLAKKVIGCKDNKARMELALELGFDFTAEEMRAATAELTDEELDLVAGGRKQCQIIGCEVPPELEWELLAR